MFVTKNIFVFNHFGGKYFFCVCLGVFAFVIIEHCSFYMSDQPGGDVLYSVAP